MALLFPVNVNPTLNGQDISEEKLLEGAWRQAGYHIRSSFTSDEFNPIAVAFYGSRSQKLPGQEPWPDGAHRTSDIDILLEYEGSIREDDAFNFLQGLDLEFWGIKVDFNPIKEEKTGNITDSLKRMGYAPGIIGEIEDENLHFAYNPPRSQEEIYYLQPETNFVKIVNRLKETLAVIMGEHNVQAFFSMQKLKPEGERIQPFPCPRVKRSVDGVGYENRVYWVSPEENPKRASPPVGHDRRERGVTDFKSDELDPILVHRINNKPGTWDEKKQMLQLAIMIAKNGTKFVSEDEIVIRAWDELGLSQSRTMQLLIDLRSYPLVIGRKIDKKTGRRFKEYKIIAVQKPTKKILRQLGRANEKRKAANIINCKHFLLDRPGSRALGRCKLDIFPDQKRTAGMPIYSVESCVGHRSGEEGNKFSCIYRTPKDIPPEGFLSRTAGEPSDLYKRSGRRARRQRGYFPGARSINDELDENPPAWINAQKCPKCGAELALGAGFERISEPAKDSIYGRDVVQVQCEKCNTYFGTIDAETQESLDPTPNPRIDNTFPHPSWPFDRGSIEPGKPQQWLENMSPEFQKWFGGSVVVEYGSQPALYPDAFGPKIVYHGTRSEFETFDLSKLGTQAHARTSNLGFFFTDHPSVASIFGEQIIPVYLKMQVPFVIDKDKSFTHLPPVNDPFEMLWREVQWWAKKDRRSDVTVDDLVDYRKHLMSRGYDGIIVPKTRMDMPLVGQQTSTFYIVFTPEQIKSVYNDGSWDPQSPNILNPQIVGEVQENPSDLEKVQREIPDLLKDRVYGGAYEEFGHWGENLTGVILFDNGPAFVSDNVPLKFYKDGYVSDETGYYWPTHRSMRVKALNLHPTLNGWESSVNGVYNTKENLLQFESNVFNPTYFFALRNLIGQAGITEETLVIFDPWSQRQRLLPLNEFLDKISSLPPIPTIDEVVASFAGDDADPEIPNPPVDDYYSFPEDQEFEIWYHGSPSGELGKGVGGIHLGTYQAAKEALEARIGIPVEGEWDGTREYSETLLKGQGSLGKFQKTGFNCQAPQNDYYPFERLGSDEIDSDELWPHYSTGEPITPDLRPSIVAYKIVGPMYNDPWEPVGDEEANLEIREGPTHYVGYYYQNIGEDAGSISAVVPSADFLEKIP